MFALNEWASDVRMGCGVGDAALASTHFLSPLLYSHLFVFPWFGLFFVFVFAFVCGLFVWFGYNWEGS